MNTNNGFIGVRIKGKLIYIRVEDAGVDSMATAELTHANVQSLRATLEEALIHLDYPEIYQGRENDNLEQP